MNTRPLQPCRLALLLALACTEYDLARAEGTAEPGADTATPTGTATTATTPSTRTTPTFTATGTTEAPAACDVELPPAEEVGEGETCAVGETGGFTPKVEWTAGSAGCLALPVVADLDGDGLPEILVNESYGIGTGTIKAYHGDGSGQMLSLSTPAGYGAAPAVGDVTGDGSPDIAVVREYENSLLAEGDYTVVLHDASGGVIWESDHFIGRDFDYATAPILSDMDHDGSVEIIAGRVILNADGSTRGVGEHGRGSWGIEDLLKDYGIVISEASVPAVADLDLDGVEEVIVGDAMYDPDGNTLVHSPSQEDGMVGVANLDGDAEGELVIVSFDTVRAVDTDGSILWGPMSIPRANIVSPPAIADLAGDGQVEIVVAGGNTLWTLNHDGSELWSASVRDESGATGASIFDFEGDGQLEVIYIDEIEMVAYDGATGAVKYLSSEHASATMFDYPVVADVDADGHAEIAVCHDGYSAALSVYGDADDSWADTREVWNQHAYSVTNINDDLSIPTTATPGFRAYNTWHAAPASDGWDGDGPAVDLEGEILDVCETECGAGQVYVTLRVMNRGSDALSDPVDVALYAVIAGADELVGVATLTGTLDGGWASAAITLEVDAAELDGASSLWLVVDDDGTGAGSIDECSESNNGALWGGPFCE